MAPVVVLVAAGALALLAVVRLSFAYATQEGQQGEAPRTFPAESGIARQPGRASLLMFVHPDCPCTRASLRELERVLAEPHDARTTLVIAPSLSGSFEQGAAGAIAARIPGVQLFADADQREGRRFAALTSGHVLLYDAAGELAFAGGITSSRGHEGDNLGARGLLAKLRQEQGLGRHAVFGCPLEDAP